jgi:hypothetical protein
MLCLGGNLYCVVAIYRRRRQHGETAIRQSSCGATRLLDVCVGILQYTGSSVAPADPQIPEAKYAANISLICGLLGLSVSSSSQVRRHHIARPQLIHDPGTFSNIGKFLALPAWTGDLGC